MDQVGECKLPHPHPISGPTVHLLHPFSCRRFIWFGNRFLVGSFWSGPSPRFVEHLTHSHHKLGYLKPMLVPKLTISIPFSFTPSRKRKQSLEEPYRKLKFCGIGKSSIERQVASMASGMIYWYCYFDSISEFYFTFVQKRKLKSNILFYCGL